MTLFKRHIGRRVAGVGVGVALLMLGLEAPAFAVAPTIASVSPTSGPFATGAPGLNTGGCVVVVTGTNFNNPNVTSVKFGTTAATFTIQSGTTLWTTVPVGVVAGATTITVDNGSPPAAVVAFTVTDPATDPGGCAPTVASFTPTCGTVGTTVTMTGTNLLKKDDGTGATVRFSPYGDTAALGLASHTGAAESPTSLSVLVPSGAADGPIRASTFNNAIGVGAALSAARFDVVTDPAQCAAPTPTDHGRNITLSVRKRPARLVARGVVSLTDTTDTFTQCVAGVPVKIQRRRTGGWSTVGSTTTTSTGSYKRAIRKRAGKYRAKAPAVQKTVDTTVNNCLGATSRVVRVRL